MSGEAWITGVGYHDDDANRIESPATGGSTNQPEPGSSSEPIDDAGEPSITGDDGTMRLLRASLVSVTRPRWVWDRRIPAAGSTLIPGREGLGKTVLAGHLSARLTRGQLAGDWLGRPAHVVYIGVEDDRSSVLVPRLIAAGADLDCFHFLAMPEGEPFSITADTHDLRTLLETLGEDLALVIVDPLDSHLGGTVDSHRKAEVQRAIGMGASLAQDFECGFLGIAHLNKGEARDVLLRVVGSVGFTTSVRSVLGVGPHPDNPDDKVAVLCKSNLTDATAVPAVRFKIEGTKVPHPDGDTVNTARLEILGEETGIDPDSIVRAGGAEERSERKEAADWLTEVLAAGPIDSGELKRLAHDVGIAERTLHRARPLAGVVIVRDDTRRGRPSRWQLESSCPPVSCHPYASPGGTNPRSDGIGSDCVSGGGFVSPRRCSGTRPDPGPR